MSEHAKHLAGLRAFAGEMIQAALDGGDMDGASIQESAIKHGLLAAQQMPAPCCGPEDGYCRCAYTTEFPAECFRPTQAMIEADQRDARIAELEAQAGNGTSGNKYRAELYDEVWQAARDMGYGNVTGALQELAALKAQQRGGVVLPERDPYENPGSEYFHGYNSGFNSGLDEVARLNQPTASAGVADEREAFEDAIGTSIVAEQGKFSLSRSYDSGNPYTFLATRWAYEGWQARARLNTTHASAGAADEREAYVYWITTEHGDVFDKGLAEHYWEKEHVSALSWQARARLNPCRAKAVQICKLGMYGQAYDTPGTYRAYTYADQPGNVIAHTLGGCLRAAHCDGGGDFIDFGLALLMRLQDRGFGVFQIAAAPSAKKESGDE